jgi:hypothetical protein
MAIWSAVNPHVDRPPDKIAQIEFLAGSRSLPNKDIKSTQATHRINSEAHASNVRRRVVRPRRSDFCAVAIIT